MLKKIVKNLIKEAVCYIPSDYLIVHLHYLHHFQRLGNFKRPERFSEYIQWKKLYDRSPILTQTACKWEVRKFVSDIVSDPILTEVYQVASHPDEIDYARLPAEFVIKATHGSSMNIFVRDVAKLDKQQAHRTLYKWLRTNYYRHGRQWAYKNIVPRILIEEFLPSGENVVPDDYKFFCSYGKIFFIQMDRGRYATHERSLFSPAWELLDVTLSYPKVTTAAARPENLDKMLQYAALLSRELDFCRIDFYDLGSRVVFGEMTHYPGSGFEKFSPDQFDLSFGRLILGNKK